MNLDNSARQHSIGRRIVIIALLLVTPVCVYWQALSCDFVSWDDSMFVYDNPYLKPVTREHVAEFWKAPYKALYVPVAYSVWAGIAALDKGGDRSTFTRQFNPALYHAANLACHVLCVLLTFVLLRRLVGNEWAACAGALVFGLHPMQVASVAWVSQLKGLLATLFSLLALYLHASVVKPRTSDEGAANSQGVPSHALLREAFATLSVALAILSKPSAVVLPLVALMVDVWMLKRPLRSSLVSLLPWVVIAGVLAVVARQAQVVAYQHPAYNELWFRLLVSVDTIGFYLYKLFMPVSLCIDYGRSPGFLWEGGWIEMLWSIPLAMLAATLAFRRAGPVVWTAAGVFVVSLLPVSGLLPFEFQIYSTPDDRYVHAALIGAGIAVAALCSAFPSRKVALAVTLGLVAMGLVSTVQVGVWQNDFALYNHTCRVNPRSFLAWNNLGKHYYDIRNDLDKAEACYLESLRLRPQSAMGYYNLGMIFEDRGRLDMAATLYVESLQFDSTDANPNYRLGLLLAQKGKYDSAIVLYKRALRLKPETALLHSKLARAQFMANDLRGAVEHYTAAIALVPGATSLHLDRGIALALMDSMQTAIADFRVVVRAYPDYADAQYYLQQTFERIGMSDSASAHRPGGTSREH